MIKVIVSIIETPKTKIENDGSDLRDHVTPHLRYSRRAVLNLNTFVRVSDDVTRKRKKKTELEFESACLNPEE